MESAELLVACLVAFVAVFLLLALLALVMRLLVVLFPERASPDDAAILAALASVVAVHHPGGRITSVKEIPCSTQRRPSDSG